MVRWNMIYFKSRQSLLISLYHLKLPSKSKTVTGMLCVSLSALESSRHETFGCLNQADVVLEPQSSQGGANMWISWKERLNFRTSFLGSIIQPRLLSSVSFGWTNLMQPLISYIFQGNCMSPEEEAGLEIKQEKKKEMIEEEEERERSRERGGGELVSVCSNRSSRSLFHSGIFGFFQSGCCSSGSGSLWLVRTLPVWHPDMDPSLRSRITVCLVIALAQVIAVTCQEDAKNGEGKPDKSDCVCCRLIVFFCVDTWYVGVADRFMQKGHKDVLACFCFCGRLWWNKHA